MSSAARHDVAAAADGTAADGPRAGRTSANGTAADETAADETAAGRTSADESSADETSTDGTSADGTSADRPATEGSGAGTSTEEAATEGTGTDRTAAEEGTGANGTSAEGNGPKQPRAARWLASARDWSRSTGAFDTAVCTVYVIFAFWVTGGLWPNPNVRAIGDNPNDQVLIEWFLAHGVLIWQGDFSFVTDRLNSPDGVNLMSNASHILHGLIMAPVTATLGAAVSFALLVALNLGATAAGWYLLFARGLGLHRVGALIAGLVTGFAPGMISQSNSHLHMTAQWLVPPIIWCVIRLTRVTAARAVGVTALVLAGLICGQLFLGEEVLFLTAFTLALFALVYVAVRWRWARSVAPRFLAGAVIAVGVSVVALAYPLWVQLEGPMHTPNAPFAPQYFFSDMASYAVLSPLSLGGSAEAGRLATSATELNAFLGLPLIVVLVGLVVWRWRTPAVLAAGIASIVMTYLSFGPHPTYEGVQTGIPSLYSKLADVPLVNGALPTRYSLALIPLIAVIIAHSVDAALRDRGVARVVVPVAIIAALVPTLPKPLDAVARPAVPEFITSGAWRDCVPEGGVLVPVPLPTPGVPDQMRWAAMANAKFGIPEGFFIGPYGPEGRSSIGTYKQPTSALLDDVARTGVIPEVTDETRAQFQADLAFWKADCVALAHVPNEAPLRVTLERLLGPGTPIVDVWTWRITR